MSDDGGRDVASDAKLGGQENAYWRTIRNTKQPYGCKVLPLFDIDFSGHTLRLMTFRFHGFSGGTNYCKEPINNSF